MSDFLQMMRYTRVRFRTKLTVGFSSSPSSPTPCPAACRAARGLRVEESSARLTSSGHLIATSSSSNSLNRRCVQRKTIKITAARAARPPTTPPMIAQVPLELELLDPELLKPVGRTEAVEATLVYTLPSEPVAVMVR